MPKIICECGEILRYSLIPNPIEWLTIDKSQFCNFWYKDLKDELYIAFKSLLHCNNCGRLSFFCDGFQKEPHIYSIEKYKHDEFIANKSEFICKCGNKIGCENEIQNKFLISDVLYDNYSDHFTIDEMQVILKNMIHCDHCDRLWIYWLGRETTPICYQRMT
ncbi:hypothetical protein N5853_01445 [Bartonella sp. HY329]|uniref:hypothetical protein n=1 Tax=unclassified Bartonella TaxID=2645622 RepID=UPI0021C9B906|nr:MULTISPECIES: hypothetical protein [unclassified Bartonella]UXM95343.1 hypothetical protein N5853_01445 [Bartonella sp. HY329]UXN09668.1 hypothetical protein N5852_01450 [Bartonella sp. HY328]